MSLKSITSYGNSNVRVSNWKTTYTQSSPKMEVCAYITCYSLQNNSEGAYALHRDGVEMASATYYFNNAQIHMPMPPLIYISNASILGAVEWSIFLSSNIVVDVNDTCTMTITEF